MGKNKKKRVRNSVGGRINESYNILIGNVVRIIGGRIQEAVKLKR